MTFFTESSVGYQYILYQLVYTHGYSKSCLLIFYQIQKFLVDFWHRLFGFNFVALIFFYFWPNFLRCRHQNFEKTDPKYVFRIFFGKCLLRNCVFLARAPPAPSKLVFLGAKGTFRKVEGSCSQKWISENCTNGESFESAGVESLRGGRPLPSPQNPPLFLRLTSFCSDAISAFSLLILIVIFW